VYAKIYVLFSGEVLLTKVRGSLTGYVVQYNFYDMTYDKFRGEDFSVCELEKFERVSAISA